MTGMQWALVIVALLSGAMCVWAVLTGGPGRIRRYPRHAEWTARGATENLGGRRTLYLKDLPACRDCPHLGHRGRCPWCECRSDRTLA